MKFCNLIVLRNTAFSILFLFVVLAAGVAFYTYISKGEILDLPVLSRRELKYIAHEGGRIDGLAGTSTVEAAMLSIKGGYRFIEFDLIETSDGYLIGGHDWGHFRSSANIDFPDNKNDPMTYSLALNSKVHGKYRAATEEDLKLFISKYGIYVFTDQTTDYMKINSLGFGDHFFVETFSIFNYVSSLYYKIKRPLININSNKLGVIPSFFKTLLTNPKYVTVDVGTVKKYPGFIRWVRGRGVVIFIFTVNDPIESLYYANEYGAIVYTDDLIP